MKNLRKLLMVFMVLSLLVLSIPTFATGMTFGFKLGGGMNYMTLTDYNDYTDGWNAYLADVATVNGSYEKLHMGMEFGGEFILYFTPNIGVGIGVGFLSAGIDQGKVDWRTSGWFPIWGETNEEVKISAIPLKLSFHYNTPVSGFMNFFFNAGVGYYLGTMDWKDSGVVWIFGNFTETFDASMSTIGFHGGLGLEFKISPNISFFVEVQGRYAKFSEVKGTYDWVNIFWNESGEYTLWHHIDGDGDHQLGMYKDGDKPGSGTDVRKAALDLTGGSVGAGFIIRFGGN